MDQLKSTVDSVMGNSTGTEPKSQGQQQSSTSTSSSSSSGGDEGLLDKGVNYAQETFVGAQGTQGTASQPQEGNQSAVEQAKDEQISDFLRHKYKSSTGSDGKDGK